MDCERFREGVTTLAAGGTDPAAARHLEGCPSCAARLDVERRIVNAARLPQFDPSDEILARAYAIMPTRPRLVARLLGSGLVGAGMRANKKEDFALHVGAADVEVHLHYTAAGGGWRVTGRAPGEEWSLMRGEEGLPCLPEGRFRFVAKSLDDTAFALRKGDQEVEVPSARELIDRGP